MTIINIVCFGFGQVAKNFIKKIKSENLNINLTTTSRKNSEKKIFENIEYNCFQFSEKSFDQELIKKIESSDYILISIPPVNGEDIVVKNFQNIIENSNLKWITYLSATSVYGNHNGNWVDENSKTNPTSTNGIDRLSVEKSWLDLVERKNLPLQIFRLSGIYSNHNNILAKLSEGNVKIINKKNQFFSRIHVEDIANILFESLKKFKTKEIYNVSDDEPASMEEVILYGSELLNTEKPETVELTTIESEMVKNFYKDSKKVSNKKMKRFFGYKLKYPTYIEGLRHIRDHFI
ncbi:NAD-dependent epimerase/dehydratase family protein [Pelagibacteraceae bacterium]|nr:NAD-dependent epimerase/dehydratase family protein [Pelagibacteraceae bacterium]